MSNKIGMYNETPRVVVGNHAICRQDPNGENKSVWIEDIRTGEGAEFQDGLLAVVIEKFFDDNF